MSPDQATLAQTVVMLALRNGETPWIPPITRRSLLRRGWIELARQESSSKYLLTSTGIEALAASTLLTKAQRSLDDRAPSAVPTGYRSDSVKRSLRR
jgi:hypothetical protein